MKDEEFIMSDYWENLLNYKQEPMKKVIVNGYTYEAPQSVKVGDKVLLPTADYLRDALGDTWEGVVTSEESNYDGPCARIIQVL